MTPLMAVQTSEAHKPGQHPPPASHPLTLPAVLVT